MSAKGAMIGMVTAALADAEGMNRLMNVWMPYIDPRAPTRPEPSRAEAIDESMTSITCPFSNITIMPAAKPIMRAAENISLAPAMNSFAMVSAEYPAEKPEHIARAMNKAQISERYHPYPIAPITRKTMVNMSIFSMNILTEFLKAKNDTTANSPAATQRSHGASNDDWPSLMTQSPA